MNKNLLGLGAVVLAVAISSFTTSRFDSVYFLYKGTGSQTSLSSYTHQTTSPGTIDGLSVQAWFIGQAADPANPTTTEFQSAFQAIDNNYGGTVSNSLNDETSEDHTNFEKKN